MNRRGERGLTLIEILLALIVMVLGIVGILALFPAAMESAKMSMEETQAAILGESVANSLATAARFSVLAPPMAVTQHYQLTVNHDSIRSQDNALVYYQFWLPNFTDGMGPGPTPNSGTNWFHHPIAPGPGIGAVSASTPELEPDWRLTGDPWTKAQYDMIKGTSPTTGTDGSEPLAQFAYSWDCRKINTLEYLMAPPPAGTSQTVAQLDPLVRVWEFRIHTFRTTTAGSVGTGTGSAVAGVTSKRLIATMSTRITVR